jgi:DNA-binding MarR family transcriptional regulator
VYLTKAGRRRLDELHVIAQEMDGELRELLSAREVELLGTTLMRIHDHFNPTSDVPQEVRGGNAR